MNLLPSVVRTRPFSPISSLFFAHESRNLMRRLPIFIVLSAVLSFAAAFASDGDSNPLKAISTAVKAGEYDRALELAKTFGEKEPAPKELEEILFQSGFASVKEMKLEAAAGF